MTLPFDALLVGIGLLGFVWPIWQLVSGRPLRLSRRRSLTGRSLRAYASLPLVGSLGLILFGVGDALAISALAATGAVAVALNMVLYFAMFGPVLFRRQ